MVAAVRKYATGGGFILYFDYDKNGKLVLKRKSL